MAWTGTRSCEKSRQSSKKGWFGGSEQDERYEDDSLKQKVDSLTQENATLQRDLEEQKKIITKRIENSDQKYTSFKTVSLH